MKAQCRRRQSEEVLRDWKMEGYREGASDRESKRLFLFDGRAEPSESGRERHENPNHFFEKYLLKMLIEVQVIIPSRHIASYPNMVLDVL